jgi:hydrogenase maturation protease
MDPRTVVIGLGNPVRADDSVGLAVIHELRERLTGEEGIELVELWAGGLRLVEAMVGFERAVVVDAMCSGDVAPGTFRRLTLADLGVTRTTTCSHDTSLPTALETWKRMEVPVPEDLTIWGIEVQDTETFSEALTHSVAQAVPRVAAAILAELQGSKGA